MIDPQEIIDHFTSAVGDATRHLSREEYCEVLKCIADNLCVSVECVEDEIRRDENSE